MTDVSDSLAVLEDAIASGKLSDPLADQARALAQQVKQPVRVSVLGLPGTGKSQIVNILAGDTIIPLGVSLPALQVTYGDVAEAECTLADGSKVTVKNGDLARAAELSPAFVTARYPLPAFRKLSLLEVAPGAAPENQRRALSWAAKRTDLAIWCTAGPFGEDEQGYLELMPDLVLDHSLLLLTKADQLAEQGRLPEVLAATKNAGRDFVDTILPIDCASALAARGPVGQIDRDILRASGAMAMISSIRKTIDAGRQAMLDKVDVFLNQAGHTAKPAAEHAAQVDDVLATPVAQEPAALKQAVPLRTTAETAIAPMPASEVAPALENVPLKPASREICATSIKQLQDEGNFMTGMLAESALESETIIDTCADTIIWLSDYLDEAGPAGDTAMDAVKELASEGADLIQLIKLESGENVPADALSLLVQLRQELQAALAA